MEVYDYVEISQARLYLSMIINAVPDPAHDYFLGIRSGDVVPVHDDLPCP